MSIRLSDEELKALQGLPHSVCWLYVMIRSRMDYRSGLVGAMPGARISWKALMEEMYVDPHQGVTGAGSPAKSKVRRWVQWLIKAGVLQVVDDADGYLVFFCAFATTDKSAKNKPGTNPAYPEKSKPDTLEPSCDEGLQDKPGTNPAYHETEKPGIHPVSGIDKQTDRSRARDGCLNWGGVFDVLSQGISETTLGKPYNRGKIGAIVKLGVTLEELNKVMSRACLAKGEEAFGPAYVKTIIERDRLGNTGGSYEKRGSGGAGSRRLSPGERAAEQERSLS